MRIFYLTNNWVGWQALNWLLEQGEQIVGLAVHPSGREKYRDEILRSAQLPSDQVFDGSRINREVTLAKIVSLQADIALSVFFGYILKPPFIEIFPSGVVNLHPAYLPYNRGAHPNIWSIIEDTPAGATLHYIDSGIDTGDVISQRKVEAEPIDTGQSLYRKLETCCLDLFKETWPFIRQGNVLRQPQLQHDGTVHRAKDIEQIDHIDLDRPYLARDLINLIRARTFPPYSGAFFTEKGRRVYVRLQLFYEEQLPQ